ncbi:hypothetical protein JX266_014182 [Neoarthrinium moseri]|nr:hypothetical protein JX266_014182 [Neoarthrinium moseri]
MRCFSAFVAVASLARAISAHYFFDVLVVNGTETASYEYVRENSRSIKYMPTKYINTYDYLTPDNTDFRCNLGATNNGQTIKTAEVTAGSTLAMKLAVGATMKHPGPAQETTCNDGDLTTTAWCTWNMDRVTFTIPAATPNGEYLVRSEHIGMHGAQVGEAEFFYSCAQIKIAGCGSGNPGPLVTIPGVYRQADEAINFSIYGAKNYTLVPGPEVWNGESINLNETSFESSGKTSATIVSSIVKTTSPSASLPETLTSIWHSIQYC